MATTPYLFRFNIGYSATTKKYVAALRAALGFAKFRAELMKFLNAEAKAAAKFIAKNFLSGQALNPVTGTMRRTIEGQGVVFRNVPGIKVGWFRGPAVRYARVQEEGTVGAGGSLPTIRPTKKQALSVPGPKVENAKGEDKYGGPRHYPGKLVFIPFRKAALAGKVIGGLYDARDLARARRIGRRSTTRYSLRDIKLAYLLLRYVDIKPKHFLRDGMALFLPGFLQRLEQFFVRLITRELAA